MVEEKKLTIDQAVGQVFLVTSWGYGADHWFSWFSKTLNAHPELFAYLANEGSRPKYFPEERSRADRPNISNFIRFIADVGMTFKGVGDCYSYRPTMLKELLDDYPSLPILHLTRHPYAWLFFHVRWRMRNMRMLGGENKPLDHEWENGCDHELFQNLDLKNYEKEDTEIWATYQGMWKMNDAAADINVPIKQLPIEKIINDKEVFRDVISYLTRNNVSYSEDLLQTVYDWAWQPFGGEEQLRIIPSEYRKTWPEWKIVAFDRLVSDDARAAFEKYGYNL